MCTALVSALTDIPVKSNVAMTGEITLRGEVLPAEFVASLSTVLRPYVLDENVTVEFAAALCDMSKRSLQRKLAEKGTRYAEVRDRARFDAAKRLLRDPARQVTDIAYALGYSDPTNFARAFRRIAGISPRQYRQAYAH